MFLPVVCKRACVKGKSLLYVNCQMCILLYCQRDTETRPGRRVCVHFKNTDQGWHQQGSTLKIKQTWLESTGFQENVALKSRGFETVELMDVQVTESKDDLGIQNDKARVKL